MAPRSRTKRASLCPGAPRRGRRLVALAAFVAVVAGGCGVIRPARPELRTYYRGAGGETSQEGARDSDCLIVLLPGIGDSARAFVDQGFVAEARRADLACDLALVDAHFTYYLAQQAVERISVDVLADARRRGYREIWLAGISIGGYGAILTAREHPELVDGVVLLSPMIGVPPHDRSVIAEITEAGGLREWSGREAGREPPPHHFRDPSLAWSWLHDAAADPTREARFFVAFGTEDSRVSAYELLADALTPAQVVRASGAHDWTTWRWLWRAILTSPHWPRRSQ